MQNYFITSNTLMILKSNKNTIIVDVDNLRVININYKKLIENNCLFYGSNLQGRKLAIKKILKIKYKIPIYIKDDIILIQINSFKNNNSLYIVLNKIINYKYINNKLRIKLDNNYIIDTNLTKNKFEKLILNGLLINNILKNKNIV